jgi:protein subunit release factor A
MPPGGNMETLVVEIHAAEGGADAKLLIVEQLGVYKKYCIRRHL